MNETGAVGPLNLSTGDVPHRLAVIALVATPHVIAPALARASSDETPFDERPNWESATSILGLSPEASNSGSSSEFEDML
jgi:hypothetical protein